MFWYPTNLTVCLESSQGNADLYLKESIDDITVKDLNDTSDKILKSANPTGNDSIIIPLNSSIYQT